MTITAPGPDALPFDPEQCRSRRPHRCSGRIGCRIEPRQARRWTLTAGERLRSLLDAAGVIDRGEAVAVHWEPQARGVPHVHVVGASQTLSERLRVLAPAFGFGFVKAAR